MRPLSDLSFRDQLGHSTEVAPEAMTALGYVKNGTHFVAPCPTRLGDYPFCDVLDVPSYSWAKSMVAGVASMRLEKLYPGAMDALIADYVPACRDWKDVTFQHTLDMATGYYASDVYDEDEASEGTRQFFIADSHEQKIDLACTLYDRQSAPGETFVYHTTDTYLLGTAITAFLREKTGRAEADIFDDLIRPLWDALGTSPVAHQTRRTYDNVGQVFTGWGLTLHRDDIAKIATFLHDDGRIKGEPMLDPEMLLDALQKRDRPVGLRAVIDSQRYKNGFWAWNAGPSLGCKADLYVPAMSGYGGLTLALMPNGQIYYYISDGHAFAWARAAKASHGDTPFCEISP
jgi:CubicO group peptidase (beta-lactamase class C family)